MAAVNCHLVSTLAMGAGDSKERSEIAGSTRKIKKQKGTGTARAGSIKNPIFRGGGRIFGPRPRSYQHKLNKNVKRLARKSALSLKSKGNEIKVIEEFLPKQLSADEISLAVETAIADMNASSIRDMGRVMGVLKSQYVGQMDFGQVGPLVKEKLTA